MLKIFSLLIVCKLCTAATDDIKIYQREVSVEVEEHILGKTLILLEESSDLKSVANKLKTDLNQKYGNGWQTYAALNFDLSQLDIEHQPNTLFSFSFVEKYFAVFKSLSASTTTTANNASTIIKNITLSAKTADIVTLNEDYNTNTTLRAAVLNATKAAINNLPTTCNFNQINDWGSECLSDLVYEAHTKIRSQYPQYIWILEAGDKYSKYIQWYNSNHDIDKYYIAYRVGDLYFSAVAFPVC